MKVEKRHISDQAAHEKRNEKGKMVKADIQNKQVRDRDQYGSERAAQRNQDGVFHHLQRLHLQMDDDREKVEHGDEDDQQESDEYDGQKL